MAEFSTPMYMSQLLLTGLQDFKGKSEYVQSLDFQGTEANIGHKNAQNKNAQTSTSASAD